MFVVELKNVKLFAPVGVYAQESILKNELVVNVAVATNIELANIPYIDYTQLFHIVKSVCSLPTPFLEDILKGIYTEIKKQYTNTLINISISKLHPPIPSIMESATVSWKEF
jgi:dihydroneopterin aldolase